MEMNLGDRYSIEYLFFCALFWLFEKLFYFTISFQTKQKKNVDSHEQTFPVPVRNHNHENKIFFSELVSLSSPHLIILSNINIQLFF